MGRHLLLLALLPALALAGASKRSSARLPEPPKPPPPFQWDIPEPLGKVEVPGIVQADGIPMKLNAVVSGRRVEDLIQHFATSFSRAGLFIPPMRLQKQISKNPQLTAYDPERQIAFSVIFQANPNKTTTVILGEAHVGERRKATDGFFAPVFPGSEYPIQNDSEGLKLLAYSARASEGEVQAFYRDTLGRAGFKEVETGVFRRQAQELRLSVQKRANGTVTVRVMGGPASAEGQSPYAESTRP